MPFALGVCDYWNELDDLYKELNVTHVKLPLGYSCTVEEGKEAIAPMLNAGLEPIIDIRTDRAFLVKGFLANCPNCQAEYRIENETPNTDKACRLCETELPIVTRFQCQQMITEQDRLFVGWASNLIRGLWPDVKVFEGWGEPQCPILTAGCLAPPRLAYWLAMLKKLMPTGAQLTNGGLGIGPWKDCELQQMMGAGTMQACDSLNLHPFSFQEDPLVQAKMYDWLMAMSIYQMEKWCGRQLPIIITEWGYPSGVGAWEGSLLASSVMPTGIKAVSEADQAELIDASMEVFWYYDVGPVCVMLRDLDNEERPEFWGFHAGALGAKMHENPHDWKSYAKPSLKVYEKWGNTKPRETPGEPGRFMLSRYARGKKK